MIRVLHDWDSVTISGRQALRRGISLVVYALSKWFPWLNRWGRINGSNKALERERLAHVETLIKLAELVGITPIFGILDPVLTEYLDELTEIRLKYRVDMRQHYHIGRPPDPNRIRGWDPPLSQSIKSWNFEREFIEGRGTLEPGDLPIFHVDNPQNLRHYIDWLYAYIPIR